MNVRIGGLFPPVFAPKLIGRAWVFFSKEKIKVFSLAKELGV